MDKPCKYNCIYLYLFVKLINFVEVQLNISMKLETPKTYCVEKCTIFCFCIY